MVTKKKLATTAAATFGVALSSMYVANEMQADVLDLTYGGNASATNPFVTGSGSPLTIGLIKFQVVLGYNGTTNMVELGERNRSLPHQLSAQ